MKALKWTQLPRPALIIILRKAFSEEERGKDFSSARVLEQFDYIVSEFCAYQLQVLSGGTSHNSFAPFFPFFPLFSDGGDWVSVGHFGRLFFCWLGFACLFILQFRLISFLLSWREIFTVNLQGITKWLSECTKWCRKVSTW